MLLALKSFKPLNMYVSIKEINSLKELILVMKINNGHKL